MTLPLLDYSPSSQNSRVAGYEVPGEEYIRIHSASLEPSSDEVSDLIRAAYRQVFAEQQCLERNRLTELESQLRFGEISVRDFVRGLAMSDVFRRYAYEPNNNYRFVRLCVRRLLGREVYNDREVIARSIVLATEGLRGFIESIVDGEEYLSQFGNDTVPYQRRRLLPQRDLGETPFERMPRYGAEYRKTLEALGYFAHTDEGRSFTCPPPRWTWQREPSPVILRVWNAIVATGGVLLLLGAIAVALAAWGIIEL